MIIAMTHSKRDISAEYIALSLEKGRALGHCKYVACCPAHDDKSPSLSVTQKGDKVLYGKYSGTEVTLEGDEYLILREEDVLAIIQS